MKQIRSWMSHHPFKVVLFTFLFTFIPAIMAVTNESIFYPGLAAFMFFVIVWAVSVWRYSKHIVMAMIIASILSSHAKAKEPDPPIQPAAALAVGAVVICVGGICIYKIVKVCQKKFPPKSTNAPPESLTASGEDEYAAAYEYSSIGSCYVPPSFNASGYENLFINPTTFTLNIAVKADEVVTSMIANNEEGTTQTWEQFQSEMAEHGLHLTGRPSEPQFSRGGVPCDGATVPLEFDQATGRVLQRTGGDMRRVVIERSPNLVDWSPLLQTDVGVGTRFQVVDTSRDGQSFYRVTSGAIP